MNAVCLDGAGLLIDAFVEHGQQWDMMIPCCITKDSVEALDVISAVIGRERDAGEQDADVRREQRVDDGAQILACDLHGKAAQAVVAAELNEDDVGMHGDDTVDARYGVFGGVATHALIGYAIVEAARMQ